MTHIAALLPTGCHAGRWFHFPDKDMARASRPSAIDDLSTFASSLPWKVSLALSVGSLIGLHLVAAAFVRPPTVTDTAQLGGTVIHQGIHFGAFFLQFVVPPAFALGAIASYFKRARSSRLAADVGAGLEVASLTWQQFEQLVAEGFRQQGFEVTEKGGAMPDGGIDLVLTRGQERFLVQCKQWRAQQVPVTVVRELYGVMASQQAAGGYVVTSGRFTRDAVTFAHGRNIELIDGTSLNRLLRRPASSAAASDTVPSDRPNTIPSCPRCKEPMIRRVAKRGAHAGNEFWGCRRYPKCREIVAGD